MLQEFHLTRAEARCLSPRDRADLVRWMVRRQFPRLRQGFATPAALHARRRARVARVVAQVERQAAVLDVLSRLACLGPLERRG